MASLPAGDILDASPFLLNTDGCYIAVVEINDAWMAMMLTAADCDFAVGSTELVDRIWIARAAAASEALRYCDLHRDGWPDHATRLGHATLASLIQDHLLRIVLDAVDTTCASPTTRFPLAVTEIPPDGLAVTNVPPAAPP